MAGLLSADPALAIEGGDLVAAELRRWSAASFVWGKSDCGMSVLGYVERRTGRVLAPAPRHKSVRGAVRLLRAAGGFEAYCRWVMAQLGCAKASVPVRGDVGLVDLPGSGLTACLCLGRTPTSGERQMWAARADRQTVILPATATIAWSVPCRRR